MSMLRRIAQHADSHPHSPALLGTDLRLDYAELHDSVRLMMTWLRGLQVETLALDLDNGPAWAVIDLAAMEAGMGLVPIPPFFSPAQVCHALSESGVSMVITDQPARFMQRSAGLSLQETATLGLFERTLHCLRTASASRKIPQGIQKVTFTSGTTAEPKGVLLGWQQIEPVVTSLAAAVAVRADDRHVALTPLAVLLENIAGIYLPLWCGASVALPSLAETGLLGAAGLDRQRMMQTLTRYGATTAIFSPQMLQGAVAHLAEGHAAPAALRFIALGGAAVSQRLLDDAGRLGLPVYEGYGLSESASVVTLNHPGAHLPGSVGRPLQHMELRIAADGEVLIRGNRFAGYLGESRYDSGDDWWHTGDIGYLDDEGFLHLRGRRRHIFITAFGRNVSPEWVERELIVEPAIAQAALFGEARPWNLALIVPASGAGEQEIEAAVQRVNRNLPDYARIGRWFTADTPFTLDNDQLSGTGRLRRPVIFHHYESRIEALFGQELIS
jgi:long-chain acyl-CoA synthetase